MPFRLPTDYIQIQPALRHSEEEWHAAISLVWCPARDSYTVAVTVHEGADGGDLRSEVVGAPVGSIDLSIALRHACSDVIDFERRTRNPFDDLV